MSRTEALEQVLVAARKVLEARENQMLTHIEWDALTAAVQATRSREPASEKPAVRIVFEDGLMMVMDDENLGYDCLDLGNCSLQEAGAQIDRWAGDTTSTLRLPSATWRRTLPNGKR